MSSKRKKSRILVGIPTRDRPEYLSSLLTSLLFQDIGEWDLLIVDTSTESCSVQEHPQVKRLSDTIRALGHAVTFVRVPVAGRSEATAVNRILTTAVIEDYEFVFKVDDDHVCPPKTLRKLREVILLREKEGPWPVLVSGAIPWMFKAWEEASGPEDICSVASLGERPVITMRIDPKTPSVCGDWTLKCKVEHFTRYTDDEGKGFIRESDFGAAAEFMLRPDARILWSDVGESSIYADAYWFKQLERFLDYTFWFDLSVNVWHVAAPAGGVRREGQNPDDLFYKDEEEDIYRMKCFKAFLESRDKYGK